MTRSKQESVRVLEHELGVLLRRVRRVMVDRAHHVHPDLNAVSYSVMTNLADSGPKRATEIAELFAIDKAAVSRQVQQLVDLDLVKRSPDPADGRAAILQLSEHGQDRLDEVSKARRQMLDDRLDDWTAAELAEFTTALTRYNTALD